MVFDVFNVTIVANNIFLNQALLRQISGVILKASTKNNLTNILIKQNVINRNMRVQTYFLKYYLI